MRLFRSVSCALRRDALSRSRLAYSALLACALVPRLSASDRQPPVPPRARQQAPAAPRRSRLRAACCSTAVLCGCWASGGVGTLPRELHSAATCAGVMCDGSCVSWSSETDFKLVVGRQVQRVRDGRGGALACAR